ncbi:MAG: hypothetical protein J0M29_00325 [Chitinophagales bacterium]|nr:hypothetical protein [Chitinophagales bacterium]
MKQIILSGLVVMVLFNSACSPKYQYQIFNNVTSQKSSNLSYTNEELGVEYDLWGSDLTLLVALTNKTDKPIYLDLSQSALIINGIAVSSYKDTEFVTSVSAASTRSATYVNQYGFLSHPGYGRAISSSVTMKSSPIIFLPPKSTYKRLFSYGDVASVYTAPGSKLTRGEKIKHLTFSRESTPYQFRFSLGYSGHKNLESMTFLDHEFWVESIDVMREWTFLGVKTEQKGSDMNYTNTYPYKKKNAFYLKFMPVKKRTSSGSTGF